MAEQLSAYSHWLMGLCQSYRVYVPAGVEWRGWRYTQRASGRESGRGVLGALQIGIRLQVGSVYGADRDTSIRHDTCGPPLYSHHSGVEQGGVTRVETTVRFSAGLDSSTELNGSQEPDPRDILLAWQNSCLDMSLMPSCKLAQSDLSPSFQSKLNCMLM